MVPWIVARPGVAVAEVAERFGISEAELVADLEVVWMVGLPPYTPDALVEVSMEEGRVWIQYADFFSRPLRLTPAQGLAMLASSDALLSMPGTDPTGPLARALEKLANALDVDVDGSLDIDLGAAGAEHLDPLRAAIDHRYWVDIEYFSYGRDELTNRRIVPHRITANGGAWYVEAWCSLAGGERLFRLDRIASLHVTDEPSGRPLPVEPSGSVFTADAALDRIRLRLTPAAHWVVDAYPCENVVAGDDGTILVTLAVSAERWLQRLLLRLGTNAVVVPAESFDGAQDLGPAAATAILDRYQR
jgi:proteasome accessory factor C